MINICITTQPPILFVVLSLPVTTSNRQTTHNETNKNKPGATRHCRARRWRALLENTLTVCEQDKHKKNHRMSTPLVVQVDRFSLSAARLCLLLMNRVRRIGSTFCVTTRRMDCTALSDSRMSRQLSPASLPRSFRCARSWWWLHSP